ncbi:MAG: hypothetical protein QG652_854 [Pseudomonadota bacterium]|nr:hypothetical protein [Pseudomonadota bacterium]
MIKLNKISLLLATGLFSISAIAADITKYNPKVEYSADQTMETAETSMTGKIYVTPAKERREMKMEGETMIMIIRRDKKIGWTLMPSEQMYMEMSFQQVEGQPDNLSNYKIETTDMGTETINGVKCNKSKIVMTKLDDGTKMGGFWWMTNDNIVMKMDMLAKEKGDKTRIKIELNNLKIGKQNPSLFEIPAGYSKMSMPNMQNLQDMMKDADTDEDEAEQPKGNKGGFNLNDALKMIR